MNCRGFVERILPGSRFVSKSICFHLPAVFVWNVAWCVAGMALLKSLLRGLPTCNFRPKEGEMLIYIYTHINM